MGTTNTRVVELKEHLSKFRYHGEPDYSSSRDLMTDDDKFQEWSFDCGSIFNTIRNHGKQFVGRKVRLLTGKYEGYIGVIKYYDVGRLNLDGEAGLSFSLNIYRKDGTDFVSDWSSDSRSYYPAYELELLPKEEGEE